MTVCTNGGEIGEPERTRLSERGIEVDERRVVALWLDGRDVKAIRFTDGNLRIATAVYLQPPQRPRGPLPDALGLARTESGHVQVDELYHTSVPGVFACGDMTTVMQAVQVAATAGFGAAAVLNQELVGMGCRARA